MANGDNKEFHIFRCDQSKRSRPFPPFVMFDGLRKNGVRNNNGAGHHVFKFGQAARHMIRRRHQTQRLKIVSVQPGFAFQSVFARIARHVSQRNFIPQFFGQFINRFSQQNPVDFSFTPEISSFSAFCRFSRSTAAATRSVPPVKTTIASVVVPVSSGPRLTKEANQNNPPVQAANKMNMAGSTFCVS